MLAIGPENKKIFFVHIPRTAGRYINSLFFSSGFDLHYSDYDDASNCGIHLPHLHYPLYKNLLNDDIIPEFSVIRDPFERFRSAITPILHHFYSDLNLNTFDKTELFKFIDHLREVQFKHNNWFRPQVEFISDKTLIWNYESGFDLKFKNWIYDNFNIKLENKRKDINRDAPYDHLQKFEFDEIRKEIIKDYYKKDYEQFYSK